MKRILYIETLCSSVARKKEEKEEKEKEKKKEKRKKKNDIYTYKEKSLKSTI